MKKNKICSLVLVLSFLVCCLTPVYGRGDIVNISSSEDFVEFAKNCTLDTWSQGKTVNLKCDIDLSKEKFVPVPTFGGIFNGNGYTISGVRLMSDGSHMGVFRYIQQSGTVRELNIKGDFTPGGTKSTIGAVAGENCGMIEKCSFDGIIKGENIIGGIAGKNCDSGRIVSCSSYGTVRGENSTGGIAGENNGLISECENYAEVNTVYEEKKKELTGADTDTGAIIEEYKTQKEENEEESILGHTDTGGIVGVSRGVLQGCKNNSHIGYEHIGYNVGGIAGRQSGYILGCSNNGLIKGRKDVGGIVGQMEPYIILTTSEGILSEVHHRLDELDEMVGNFGDDANRLGDDSQKHLDAISSQLKTAQDNTETLIECISDFADDNLDEINTWSAIFSNTLDKLVPVFDSIEGSADGLNGALGEVSDALNSIELYTPEIDDEIDTITDALSEISKSGENIKKGVSKFKRACSELDDVITFDNDMQAREASKALTESVKEIIAAKQDIESALARIEEILKTKPESFEAIGINAKEVLEKVKSIRENISLTVSGLETIEKSIETIILNLNIDLHELKFAAGDMESAIVYIGNAMYYLTESISGMSEAFSDLYDKLDEYGNDISDDINAAKDDLSSALDSVSYATDDLKTAIGDVGDIISDLSDEEPIEFVKLGDNFDTASDDLFDSVSGISDEIELLKDTLSIGKDNIVDDIEEIKEQFGLIMDLLLDEADEKDEVSSDIFVDESDEEIEKTKQGKVEECTNFGDVEADRNTGGIVGAMAVEYSKDPEDDIEKPDTLDFTYRTKTVLYNCENDGTITGKKDCVGGGVGFSEIGTVYGCENYGDIESTSGNYVGGIVGKSESSVRKSCAKSAVKGNHSVGGIAGKADILVLCASIVTLEGDESVGAVCGETEDRNNLSANVYVGDAVGGVDGVSYGGKAEEVSFEELKNMPSVPKRFVSFKITFKADEKIIGTQDIKYGESTQRIRYPDIPDKNGEYGEWEKPEEETVTGNMEIRAEYKPYITLLGSEEKNESGKLSLALAEGHFTDKAVFNIKASAAEKPTGVSADSEVYDISLRNTSLQNGDDVTVRILNEDKKNVNGWRFNNGVWEQTAVKARGKYVILTAVGPQSTICLEYTERTFNFMWLLTIAPILLIAVLMIVLKKRKKAKKINPSAAEDSNEQSNAVEEGALTE